MQRFPVDTFRSLHHPEFRVIDPVGMGDRLAEVFGGVAGPPSANSGSVMVELPWGAVELKPVDAQHPASGSVLGLEVLSNDDVYAVLNENNIVPDLSKSGSSNGPIFFTVTHGNDKIDFHSIIVVQPTE